MFFRDFFFIYVPFSLLSFVLPLFVYNPCCVTVFLCVYLSITFVVRNICLFYACMTPTPLHTHWGIRPYTWVYVRHRKWRSICGHAGSPTRLITVKPHLKLSSFDDMLSLVVPVTIMLLSKRMISLEALKVTYNYPWGLSPDSKLLIPSIRILN